MKLHDERRWQNRYNIYFEGTIISWKFTHVFGGRTRSHGKCAERSLPWVIFVCESSFIYSPIVPHTAKDRASLRLTGPWCAIGPWICPNMNTFILQLSNIVEKCHQMLRERYSNEGEETERERRSPNGREGGERKKGAKGGGGIQESWLNSWSAVSVIFPRTTSEVELTRKSLDLRTNKKKKHSRCKGKRNFLFYQRFFFSRHR